MGGTDGLGLIIYSGSRDELQAKLRARDERITELESVLRWFVDNGETAFTTCPDKDRGCRAVRVQYSEYSADRWCDCCRAADALGE